MHRQVRHNLTLATLILTLALFSRLPAFAQDDAQSAITNALVDFAALESFRFTAETTLQQETQFGANTAIIRTLQNIDGAWTMTANEAEIAVEQTISGDTDPLIWSVNVDRVAVEDMVYLRFRDLLLPPTVSAQAFALPEGWFAPEPLPTDMAMLTASAMGLFTFIDGYRSLPVIPPIVGYPLNDETVRTLEQLPDEAIDGVTMRVYEVSFDALNLYLTHTRDEWDATFLNFQTSGIDLARFFVEGGLQVRGRYWIDADGQLAQIEQQIRLEVAPGTIEGQSDYGFINDTRARVAFSNRNMPTQIAVPDVPGAQSE
jgi:hypothetical protein